MFGFRFSYISYAGFVLLCCLSVSKSVHADTVTINPAKDNTLFDPQGGAERSSGGGVWLFTGRTSFSGGNRLRRSLFAFDVANAIPAGSTIDSAVLRILQLDAAPGLSSITVDIHRVLADWGEGTSSAGGGTGAPPTPGDATWTLRFWPTFATAWSTPGGDYDSAALASTSVDSSIFSYREWGPTSALTAVVQDWLDDPSNNFGVLVRHQNEAPSQTSVKWAAREDTFSPPELVVEFTPISSGGPDFQRLDCNADGDIQVSDAVYAAGVLFVSGGPFPCAKACDANDDGIVDVADIVAALSFLFTVGGSPPPPPFPGCGADPTADTLTCDLPGLCP